MGRYSHLLRQTIKAYKSTGSNDYGDNIDGPEQTLKARIEFVNKSMRLEGGEVIPISVRVWLEPTTNSIDTGDQIKIDDVSYRVMARKSIPDATGKNGLFEMECSEWR